jgi:hypothetical protein
MAAGPQPGRSRPSPFQYAKRLLPPLRQTELLVLGFPRRILHQGKYYDPYADMLVEALDMDHLIVERPQEGHLSPVPNPRVRYLDAWYGFRHLSDELCRVMRRPGPPSTPGAWDLYKFQRRALRKYLEFILNRTKPSVVLTTGSHGTELMHQLANARDIVTVHIQQGVHTTPNETTAKHVLLWGEASAQLFRAGDETSFSVGGHPFLGEFAEAETVAHKVCVLGNSTNDSELRAIAGRLGECEDGFDVWYVPHPNHRTSEDTTPESARYHLYEQTNAYEVIADASVVVGFASTLMHEAQMIGAQVFVHKDAALAEEFELFDDYADLLRKIRETEVVGPGRNKYIDHTSIVKQAETFQELLVGDAN